MHSYRRIIRPSLVLAFFAALVVPAIGQAGASLPCAVPDIGVTVDCEVSDNDPASPGLALDVTVDDGARETDVHADGDMSDNHWAYACMHNVTIGDQGPWTVGVCPSTD